MGPMMLAQGGPGSGSGPMMQQGGPRRGDAATRESRRESRMKRMAERRIQLLDTNGDGKISAEEIAAEEKRLFAAADVNGDGKLSPEEFRRRGRWFIGLGTTSFFDMLDADGDGNVSAAELTGPSERWFKRHDADKNGTIDTEEYVKARGHGARGGRR
jgi:Ca2+-binding EF-hand superfamily protein